MDKHRRYIDILKNNYRITVDLPEQTNGDFKIRKLECEPHECDGGIKTVLYHKNMPIMSDLPEELKEHLPFFSLNLSGNVLVCGLGIGFINEVLINIPDIKKVVIVEKYKEVIDMVWPYCKKDERFELIHADADTWKPNINFDFAWLDSWTQVEQETPQEEWWEIIKVKYSPYCKTTMVWKPTNKM
tara:strand:+ start:2599 stop:3156 length:558 start_codon:yes stop_codon:yes gene_type:complete